MQLLYTKLQLYPYLPVAYYSISVPDKDPCVLIICFRLGRLLFLFRTSLKCRPPGGLFSEKVLNMGIGVRNQIFVS